MKVLLIGGTFTNQNLSLHSGVIDKIKNHLLALGYCPTCHNGGTISDLESYLLNVSDYDVILWFANVIDDGDKINENIKGLAPKAILIESKRNYPTKDKKIIYSSQDLIHHMLKNKANLCCEFTISDTPNEGRYAMRVLDPLGNCFCDYTSDIGKMVSRMMDRATILHGMHRQPTIQKPSTSYPIPIDPQFTRIIRENAKTFHHLILKDVEMPRFLGNASFRCTEGGFPSFKSNDEIYMSKRNVNKEEIGSEGFVKVEWDKKDDKIYYYGDNKPSVDTPVQLRLYDAFPQIKYIIHAHVYAKGAISTSKCVPCGALEEFDEIKEVIHTECDLNGVDPLEFKEICVNLLGHGCIILSDNLDYFNTITFKQRPLPEHIN